MRPSNLHGRLFFWLALIFLLVAFPVWILLNPLAQADSGLAGTTPVRPLQLPIVSKAAVDSLTLIEWDYSAGVIDINEATKDKFYATFNSPLLPSRYQSDIPISDEGTVAFYQMVSSWDQLDLTTRQTISDFITAHVITSTGSASAPTVEGRRIVGCDMYGLTTTQHFWIFYALSGQNCSGTVTTSYINTIADGLEGAWTAYHNFGYAVPSLTYVYVSPIIPALDDRAALSLPGTPGTIFVKNNLDLNGMIGNDAGPLGLEVLVSHEFFHQVQLVYYGVCPQIGASAPAFPYPIPSSWLSFEDVRWWNEATAQWAQHEAHQDDKNYY